MSPNVVVLSITFLFLIHPLVQRGLSAALHARRLRAAELGRELLLSPFVKERDKYIFEDMLDRLFDWKFSILAVASIPLGIASEMFGRDGRSSSYISGPAAGMFGEFIRCYLMASFAANPVFAGIAMLELAAFLLPRRLHNGKPRGPASARIYILLIRIFELRKRFGLIHSR